jgi:hypothetical protein
MLIYRESHSLSVRQQIEAWTEQNFYTTCDSIIGPAVSTVHSGACGYRFRETYCNQFCQPGYTTVAGYVQLSKTATLHVPERLLALPPLAQLPVQLVRARHVAIGACDLQAILRDV